jgi:hypothetical protein
MAADPLEGLEKQMDHFEETAELLRRVSEVLTGQVRLLMEQGWTESQARDLVVAFELQAARKR